MPTWFMSRSTFDRVGGFDEAGRGTPEDLLFFYKIFELGGEILRCDDVLVAYRYHEAATSFSIPQETILRVRVAALEVRIGLCSLTEGSSKCCQI
jgi:GT2 family glycosyltransferase